jgi:pentatricopeptide repeat domain-containing protein 1
MTTAVLLYRTIIVCCSFQNGMYDEPLALLSEMQDKGLKLNVICYSAAIDACARGGQWKKGLQLLEDMRLRGIAPNQVRICFVMYIYIYLLLFSVV